MLFGMVREAMGLGDRDDGRQDGADFGPQCVTEPSEGEVGECDSAVPGKMCDVG